MAARGGSGPAHAVLHPASVGKGLLSGHRSLCGLKHRSAADARLRALALGWEIVSIEAIWTPVRAP